MSTPQESRGGLRDASKVRSANYIETAQACRNIRQTDKIWHALLYLGFQPKVLGIFKQPNYK